ncbi:hypothetical protein AGMMS49975_08920 [Clostridia bacterium]|nr:hypothetical protein AGMMS49975_08920 [Clostridia bacterium]
MKRLEFEVPDMNDSFSKVVIEEKEYLLRFTWNDTEQRWYFGIYTVLREPILQGLKLVPKFPLTLQYVDDRLPNGILGVYTKEVVVGRQDFKNKRAVFAYIPNGEGS